MDWDAEHILLRTVRCVSGTVEMVMSCEPSFDYHRVSSAWEYSGPAYGEAIARASAPMPLDTDPEVEWEGNVAHPRFGAGKRPGHPHNLH